MRSARLPSYRRMYWRKTDSPWRFSTQSDLRKVPSSTKVIFTSSVIETGVRSVVSFNTSHAGQLYDLFWVKSARRIAFPAFTSSLPFFLSVRETISPFLSNVILYREFSKVLTFVETLLAPVPDVRMSYTTYPVAGTVASTRMRAFPSV